MKKQKEFRALALTLDTTEESRTIKGKIPYLSLSEDLGFYERLIPGCFSKTINDGADIRMILEHDDAKLLARRKNDSLHLTDMPDGLYFEFEAPNTSLGDDALEMVRTGLISGCSFGFICLRDDYHYEDGKEIRDVKECRLLEISLVTSIPAYPESQVYCRSLSQAFANKTELSEDEQKAALAEIEKLQALLPKVEEPVVETKEEPVVEEEKGPTEEELKAQEEAAAKEAEEMQKLYERLEAAQKILESA